MRHRLKTKDRGFTLMEILVVMIVLGVVATLAVPSYNMVVERMRAKEGADILPAVLAAQKRYELETGSSANNLSQLDITLPNLEYFDAPTLTGAVIRIRRNGSNPYNYRLEMNSTGTITCQGSSICGKLGY